MLVAAAVKGQIDTSFPETAAEVLAAAFQCEDSSVYRVPFL